MDFVNTLRGQKFVVPLVFFAALMMLLVSEIAYWQTRSSVDNLATTGQTRITILKLTENLINADSVQRGYVLTGDASLLRSLAESKQNLADTFAELAADFSQNPAFIDALNPVVSG